MGKPYNEPAFPHPGGSGDITVQQSFIGMSVRDYFAAEFASAAYAEAPSVSKWEMDALFGKERTGIRREEIAAALAYRMADAMLIERNKA